MELAGQVAIVTGANHGIGAATARLLAERGASVLVTDIHLDGTDGVEADLGDPQAPALLFGAAEDRFGPVSILINNATGWIQDSFVPGDDRFGRATAPVSAETFAQLEVDARGAALLIAELAWRHIARGGTSGRIVGLTSGGVDGFPGEVSYGAAKAALESYTLSAAWELGPFGVTANVVHPPVTDTGWITPKIETEAVQASPFRRIGQPQDVAEVICMLCGSSARFITGNRIQMR